MALFRSFGKTPSGARSATILQSPNFKQGAFQNLSETSMLAKGALMRNLVRFFNRPSNTAPSGPLPSIKTDLTTISSAKPVVVWFGHSSYFIRINEKNILVDPVFSGHASPFSFGVKSFPGSDIYAAADFPQIDLLILTHDHYDHLDYHTLLELKPKIKSICTSIGVGSHLEYWGFPPALITELDWWENAQPAAGLDLTATPARHFSGRSFRRNRSLWSSFVLSSGNYRIFIGADSGYDTHFREIGERFGPFDLALLETGQYNEDWQFIHMMPEQAVQAAVDLKAKWMMPVHWAKFALAYHPWAEPVERVMTKASGMNVHVTTPRIGEPVILDESYPSSSWWNNGARNNSL